MALGSVLFCLASIMSALSSVSISSAQVPEGRYQRHLGTVDFWGQPLRPSEDVSMESVVLGLFFFIGGLEEELHNHIYEPLPRCPTTEPRIEELTPAFFEQYPNQISLYQDLLGKKESPRDFYHHFFRCLAKKDLDPYFEAWPEFENLLTEVNTKMNLSQLMGVISFSIGGYAFLHRQVIGLLDDNHPLFHRAIVASLSASHRYWDEVEKARQILTLYYGPENPRIGLSREDRPLYDRVLKSLEEPI